MALAESVYEPSDIVRNASYVKSLEDFRKLYTESIDDPAKFWNTFVSELYFEQKPSPEKFLLYNFDIRKGQPYVSWLSDAVTNLCYNCLDLNVKNGNGEKVAFYWIGNEPGEELKYTYKEILEEVCRIANALKGLGIRKGDRVGIYMALAPEILFVMLAAARIGAVHIVIFGGYSANALAARLIDSKASVLFTIDGCYRATKLIKMKQIADEAMEICKQSNHSIKTCVIKKHLSRFKDFSGENYPELNFDGKELILYEDFIKDMDSECQPCWVKGDDPAFILHTSGSTGTPKGIIHGVGGYMLYSKVTFKYTFDYKNDEVFFCTGDVGWITGHTYNCYGPMLNGATFILFEGIPLYPNAGRYWQICEKYGVSIFYTAPTAIRALMKHGDEIISQYNLSKLKVLGTVGEPINSTAWTWYYTIVGQRRCSIVDTYFQTETGGHVITPLPAAFPMKPGSASLPYFSVEAAILNENGEEQVGECSGYLVFKKPWPGMMQGIYGNQERFADVYFRKFPGYYFTGDGASRDKDGYYWVTGRIDDMMNCSGHLLSSAELEGVISSHPAVAENSVVSVPHDLKGQTPYCFIVLKNKCREQDPEKLRAELRSAVRKKIGPFAVPEEFIFTTELPKTHSGKILRHLIRSISAGVNKFDDLSTVSDKNALTDIKQAIDEQVLMLHQ